MFLNVAFDRHFDAAHRLERPIPSGQVSAREVFAYGFGLLVVGLLCVAAASRGPEGLPSWRALSSGTALAGLIVLYDAHHKGNPLSPLVMGLCRVFVYLTAAFAVAITLPAAVYYAALALLCHLIGLTYIAKQEHLGRIGNLWPLIFLALPVLYGLLLALQQPAAWVPFALYVAVLVYAMHLLRRRAAGEVPLAVVTLIAGMSVLDALLLAGAGHWIPAGVAMLAFMLTLLLQRWVSGT
jgi:4-hydroxybenzoate polyprenyltransferase